MALTDKQARFVEEYLVDLNASAAARRAGYSEKTAGAIGRENLQKPTIRAAIDEKLAKRSERTQVTADRVVEELARIGFADPRSLFTWSEERACFVPSRDLTEAEAAAVQAVESDTTHYTREDGTEEMRLKLKLKTHSKIRALELLGKHMAMFTDRRAEEFGGEPRIEIVEVNLPEDSEAA